VADIVAKLGKRILRARAREAEPPCFERQETSDLPQQARLAGAVRAGHQQRLAGRKRKAQAREEHPAAALAADLMGGEADPFRHLLRICAC